ncbi:MAG: DUF1926 domain-containing protein [Candidatus Omnitrophica bacterium]|nr:DUF1926 domain-containing protein [Candidatus Omnitrophota bacterium]
MTTGITRLILGVHGHQPVGNFDWVFEEAYTTSYRPFLEVIERHPAIRWSLHWSGPLVAWLEARHPEAIRRVAALVRRGQVEVLGGGIGEPVFALIPERDGLGQLRRFTDRLVRLKLGTPRGAWLPERVWEPSLPRLFRAAGFDYTIVDDHHLTLAGAGPQAAFGYWMTDDAGDTLALFPSSKALRYLVPFRPVEEVIEHLRGLRSETPRAVVLADDLEKFGLWPGTSRWVYDEGWLESFCRAVERESSWLTTSTFRQYLDAHPPLGQVYVPCASYQEMGEWSGGHFRQFLTKYPEANTMHKKMLMISRRFERAAPRLRPAARRAVEAHLYRGQCNCAYWHGVFGGLYLSHLRAAVYRELLAAERWLDRAAHGARAWAAVETDDADGDGRPDLQLRSGLMNLWIDPAHGGAIVEWDDKVRGLNLVNTLTRRPEAYHAKLRERQTVVAGAGLDGPATIHAGVRVTEPDLETHLVYDRYRRAAAVDHLWLGDVGDAQAFARGQLPDSAAGLERPYRWTVQRPATGVHVTLQREARLAQGGIETPVRITKRIHLSRRRPEVVVEYTVLTLGAAPQPMRLATEWNLALKDPHYNRVGEIPAARRLWLTDSHQDVTVGLEASAPATVWYAPVETVSDSDRGLERTYQQMSLALSWTFTAAPRRPWRVVVTARVQSGGVHAAV